MSKRQRVLRACDQCRRGKIRCDGKQPCAHCIVYDYECSYDQITKRSRSEPSYYVKALEARLRRAEAVVRIAAPNVNLSDPRLDTADTAQIAAIINQASPQGVLASRLTPTSSPDGTMPAEDSNESFLETMMENFGFLDLDDRGHWDYHGHSSGSIFTQRLQNQFGNLIIPPRSLTKSKPRSKPQKRPELQTRKSQDKNSNSTDTTPISGLPSQEIARKLSQTCFDHACVLMRFIHEPSFWKSFDRIFATSWDQFGDEERIFLPQLYIVLAVGCLFLDDVKPPIEIADYEIVLDQGYRYFELCQELVDMADCRDLVTLQTICFMILFLQSSAKLSTCYSYIGIAQRAALRLGLHRLVSGNFNALERELRKRIFWAIRNMDIYVSTLLGLPLLVSSDDIDQEYPLEVDDEYITPAGILPMPVGRTSLMMGVNAHTRLVDIIVKVVKYIYPVRHATHLAPSNHTYVVRHSRLREIEKDLESWMKSLPEVLQSRSETSPKLAQMQQMLRIGYAHVQWVMYRPFLHYISNDFQSQDIDRRSYGCATACISVSRNIIHITTEMYNKRLLNGSSWFAVHTIYYAVLTLAYFLLENPGPPATTDGILKDTLEGKNTLAGLANNSIAVERCACLYSLIEHLPERLNKRKSPVIQPTNEKGSTVPEAASNLRRKDSTSDRLGAYTLNRPISSASGTVPSTELPVKGHYVPAQQITHEHAAPDQIFLRFSANDPFAYPSQSLSSIDDDVFRNEAGETSIHLPSDPTMQVYAPMSDEHSLSDDMVPFYNFLGPPSETVYVNASYNPSIQ
ncbi:putative C6 transcription factor [Trichoderma camerunense]